MRRLLSLFLVVMMVLAGTLAAGAAEVPGVQAQAKPPLGGLARTIEGRLGQLKLRLDWSSVRIETDEKSSEAVGAEVSIYSVPIVDVGTKLTRNGPIGALVAVRVDGAIKSVSLFFLPAYASVAETLSTICSTVVLSPAVKAASIPYDWTHIYTYVFQAGIYEILNFSFGGTVGTAVGIIFVIIDGFEDTNGNVYETSTYYYGPPEYVIMPNGTIAYL